MSTAPFFAFASTRRRMYAGPLGPHIDELIAQLQGQNYARHSIRCKIRVVADFSRWLAKHHTRANVIDANHAQRFLADRRRAARQTLGDTAALRQMVDLLRQRHVTEPSIRSSALSERERVEKDFTEHLLRDQGLTPSTPVCYLRHISRFLQERFGNSPLRFDQLVGVDITGFIGRHTRGYSSSRAQQVVTALRSFLQYLRLRGLIGIELTACLPKIAHWSLAKLPAFLRPYQVKRVLRLCDRGSAAGRREYAMLLLLARLGLRIGEVAALTLDSINWQDGILTVRGKGGQWSQMPLPQDVGEAIVDYLEHGRPLCSERHLFVCTKAPWRGFRGASRISTIASRALARARIVHPSGGGHVFRHALATEMLRRGASLAEIGRLLRHQHPDTTRIYAKVDLTALRRLAMPWPGGAR
jgi:site-specific recombinase XerD